jgi:hypothetical protein
LEEKNGISCTGSSPGSWYKCVLLDEVISLTFNKRFQRRNSPATALFLFLSFSVILNEMKDLSGMRDCAAHSGEILRYAQNDKQ